MKYLLTQTLYWRLDCVPGFRALGGPGLDGGELEVCLRLGQRDLHAPHIRWSDLHGQQVRPDTGLTSTELLNLPNELDRYRQISVQTEYIYLSEFSNFSKKVSNKK